MENLHTRFLRSQGSEVSALVTGVKTFTCLQRAAPYWTLLNTMCFQLSSPRNPASNQHSGLERIHSLPWNS